MVGIINLFVHDLFGTRGKEMEQRVLARLRKNVHVGSEDWNDVTFTRQRFRWTQAPQTGSYIDVVKNRPLRSWRRSQWKKKHEGSQGQTNWLQSRT